MSYFIAVVIIFLHIYTLGLFIKYIISKELEFVTKNDRRYLFFFDIVSKSHILFMLQIIIRFKNKNL